MSNFEHRVASLRRSFEGMDKHYHSDCSQGRQQVWCSQSGTATQTLPSLSYDTPSTTPVVVNAAATPSEGSGGRYVVPASMQHPHLSAPIRSQRPLCPRIETKTTHTHLINDSATRAGTQNVNCPQQHQHTTELVGALLAVTETMRVQGQHMAAGCQSLQHLSTIAEGQRAQVVVMEELVAEVRAMVKAFHEMHDRALGPANRIKRATLSAPRKETRRPWWHTSKHVLGAESLSGETSTKRGNTYNSHNKGRSKVHGNRWKSGTDDDQGAAYSTGAAPKHVALRGPGGAAERPDVTCKTECIEDDIFLM